MRFHEVFVNRSNFEPLKIEETIFVKMQVCENRYVLLNMNSPKCATIRDSLALLTKSLNLSPLPSAGQIFKTLTKLMWGHFNWKDLSNFISLMVHSELLPLAIIDLIIR